MNIKEIIAADQWRTFDDPPEVGRLIAGNELTRAAIRKHNEALDRIQRAADESIKELEAATAKRIAELVAQVPKVVRPKIHHGASMDTARCACGRELRLPFLGKPTDFFCPYCGAKLNWDEK